MESLAPDERMKYEAPLQGGAKLNWSQIDSSRTATNENSHPQEKCTQSNNVPIEYSLFDAMLKAA